HFSGAGSFVFNGYFFGSQCTIKDFDITDVAVDRVGVIINMSAYIESITCVCTQSRIPSLKDTINIKTHSVRIEHRANMIPGIQYRNDAPSSMYLGCCSIRDTKWQGGTVACDVR